MKRVTITLDENVVRWVRAQASRQGTSVSRMINELLRERMMREESYDAAMRQYLAVAPRVLSTGGRYPSRDEIYDRSRDEAGPTDPNHSAPPS